MKAVWLLIGLCVVALAGGGATWFVRTRPEITPSLRGRQIADRLGCFACHGPEGRGGVPDPTAAGGTVPGWSAGALVMFIRTEQHLREWILLGRPNDDELAGPELSSESLVPMPAYRDDLNDRELDDLVAYIKAVSGWAGGIPDEAYEGRKAAVRLGCFGCHGLSGMGGVPNPGSFKGYIPPWDGHEFAELVRSEAELREWILDGRIERLWGNRAARFFLERQKTPMPAYREHISAHELDQVVAYIKWLRGGAAADRGAEVPIA